MRQTIWTDRRITAALFIGVLCVYVAVYRGRLEIYDTQAMMGVTQNLVNHGSLTSSGAGYPVSTAYAPYGIAVSLLAVIPYVLSKVTGNFAGLVSMVAPVLTALSVVLIYWIARALNWRASHGLIAAVGYGLFSMALWYTTELLSEPGVTLCVLAIVLGLIRWRQGSHIAPLWIGIAAGCAVQFRSDSLFTVWIALLAAPLFVPWAVLRSRRTLASVLGPMAVSLAAVGWYNQLRFHRIFVSTYRSNGGFITPLWHGLDGLLLSPGRSLFLFNPLTVVGVVGLVLLLVGPGRLRDRPLGTLCLLLVVPRILFFAKWGIWDGGSVWGPRFLLPVVAVLTLTLVPVLQATDPRRLSGVLVRTAAVLLAILAALINYLSVRLPLGEWLGVLGSPVWRARFGIHGLKTGGEQAAALDFHFATAPIWGYITLLRRNVIITSGEWWASGHGVVGFVLLGAGAVSLTAAAVGTRRRPRHRPCEHAEVAGTPAKVAPGSGHPTPIQRRLEPAGQGTQPLQGVDGHGPTGYGE